ncbi:methyltransferase domain-containing protein [Acidisphaera sp. S103]|uniref:methyltransferase domain-containing protein n=1 Tax=Acidisphaera sp. S103 TaxID=1747223 RepID=UPI00131BE28C|nr:methyltransferase domain-containing protein [Acidisphaera sp. S103]
MYIVTWGYDLLAYGKNGEPLSQVRNLTPSGGQKLVDIHPDEVARLEAERPAPGECGVSITNGCLAGYQYVKGQVPSSFHLFNNKFVCAEPNRPSVICNREIPGAWETFKYLSPEAAEAYVREGRDGAEALGSRVRSLIGQNAPVRLHFGCANTLIEGFLNLDNFVFFGPFGKLKDYFLFDFTQKLWPIADASVDYIYSEDFIEHVPQKNQVAFLAESFRVLKPGGFNRVSTPCLAESMRVNSEFTKGIKGVYFEEFDKWGHVALFTKGFISDLAHAIGYSKVIFTEKNEGSSPYAVKDRRPGADRTWKDGNIFVDLMK